MLINSYYFPSLCLVCKCDLMFGRALCPECYNLLQLLSSRVCLSCADIKNFNILDKCLKCLQMQNPVDLTRALFVYGGVIKKLIYKLKYGGETNLAHFFAQCLTSFNSYVPSNSLIVPIPCHWTKIIKRGYNQAALIAKYLSLNLYLPIAYDLLFKHKITKPQEGLKKSQRFKNLVNCFKIKNYHKYKHFDNIILIDDVITTGATSKECALTLKKAGFKSVLLFAVAKTI